MGNPVLSLPVLCFFLLLSFNSDGILKLAHAQAAGQGAWCVAKPSSSHENLMNNINYACSTVNCSIIQNGGPCFSPETLENHASVAMNLYYQKVGRHFWNCDFNKSGIITVTDPSYGNCSFAFNRRSY